MDEISGKTQDKDSKTVFMPNLRKTKSLPRKSFRFKVLIYSQTKQQNVLATELPNLHQSTLIRILDIETRLKNLYPVSQNIVKISSENVNFLISSILRLRFFFLLLIRVQNYSIHPDQSKNGPFPSPFHDFILLFNNILPS